ncbi:MAG: sodium:proton antiporter [Proteobacteria bacterium]|jgi:Na+/H+ antiporter NhaD/arsenite permease-like protein|nr:sodium:proton antiporter [Pseudomonadota bacterium]
MIFRKPIFSVVALAASLLVPGAALAAGGIAAGPAEAIPVPSAWAVLPFAAYLLIIALFPLFVGRFWEKNRNKLLVAIAASLPAAAYLLLGHPNGAEWLVHSGVEYASFIALLGALFAISGGIHLKGSLAGTPLVNTALLAVGAVLASFIGTTGASMLLIRPLLRANESRQRKTHLVIFFIFIVANGGGMLTPLGDPPLFLGFLRGVPFLFTFRLFLPWALVNGALLVLANLWDQAVLNKEERERPGSQLEAVQEVKEPLRIAGGINLLWLLGVIAVNYTMGTYGSAMTDSAAIRTALQIGGMLAMAGLSLWLTPRTVREANRFTWGPMAEVAAIFVGIFVTMVPALKLLELRGGELGLTEAWQFFWATGGLSSFLDNAPTYLTFSSLAVGVVNGAHPEAGLVAENLGGLLRYPEGVLYLTAISCGAVFMGANSYIGNGPNFMVKAIAEEGKIKMPGFFGYMAWGAAILIPLFIVVTFAFFV